MKNQLNFKCEGNAIEIKIYGEIGEKDFWEQMFEDDDENKDETIVQSLDELNKLLKEHQNAATIDIYINSQGGSVFDGVAMYNCLKRHPAYKRVFIEGFACSVASVIAMCGNQIIMPKSSLMMIHNAWTVAMGNSMELRKQADDLDIINETIKNAYRKKMKISDEKLTELMDNESYISADDCLEYGLCTRIADDVEDTVQVVENGLDKMTKLYQAKLENLNAMKNCIKDIENNVEATEIVEAETGEASAIEPVEEGATEETVEETTETPVETAIETEEEAIETEAQKEVEKIQENALKRFFNLTSQEEK